MSITWSYVGRPANTVPLVGYTEIARDVTTNDVSLPIRLIRGPDACIQRLRQKFGFSLKEWFLDERLGVPYRDQVLVKNPDTGLIVSIFRRVILGTPGFARVLKMAASFDISSRTLTTSFEALLDDPSIIVRAVDAPFKLR